MKGFSTAFAIILTALISWMFLQNSITITFVVGAANVIISIFSYNEGTTPLARSVPSAVEIGRLVSSQKAMDDEEDDDLEDSQPLMHKNSLLPNTSR